MTAHRVSIRLNDQQLELLNRTVAAGAAPDLDGLIRRALRERGAGLEPAVPLRTAMPAPDEAESERRWLVSERIIAPGTGKALEILSGQILRIEQIEGPQCVDFNCFNLHDYKEVMHVGRMRAMYGLLPTKGHFIWSAPPRERAMMYILEDTARCNDVMFSRCNSYLYESVYGFGSHTNCHDIQAEAQREYGLTPDDVHDSFNMFMCTEVKDGRLQINRQRSLAGDFVELLALVDVLAVPNVCGNDVGRTSNFSLKPVKVSVFDASLRDLKQVPPLKAFPHSQRTPASFRQPQIKADRPLTRDTSYVPSFANVPLREVRVEYSLADDERDLLRQTNLHEFYGDDEASMVRDVVLSWWERVFAGELPGST